MRAKERKRERVENIKHGIVLPATKGAQLSRTAATGVAAWLAEKRRRSRGAGEQVLVPVPPMTTINIINACSKSHLFERRQAEPC